MFHHWIINTNIISVMKAAAQSRATIKHIIAQWTALSVNCRVTTCAQQRNTRASSSLKGNLRPLSYRSFNIYLRGSKKKIHPFMGSERRMNLYQSKTVTLCSLLARPLILIRWKAACTLFYFWRSHSVFKLRTRVINSKRSAEKYSLH